MATINKKYINTKSVKYRHESKEQAASFYNSMAWKRLRDTLLSHSPLCYECLQHSRVVPAEDAHHLIPFMTGKTEEEKWDLFLKESNIRMLCSKCHYGYHNKMKEYNMKSCYELTKPEYDYIHGLNYKK